MKTSLSRSLLAIAGGLLFVSGASAQTSITGRVIDPAGRPVANIEVLLHAVQEKTGMEIDKDTSRSDGSFTVSLKTADPNAVYFVAVVYNGELYLGDLMRAPFPLDKEYVVQVGVNPVNLDPAAAGTAATPEQTKADRTAGYAVIIVTALIIGTILYVALRRRPPTRRRRLLELARLEEEIANSRGPDDVLTKRRAELRARMRAAQS